MTERLAHFAAGFGLVAGVATVVLFLPLIGVSWRKSLTLTLWVGVAAPAIWVAVYPYDIFGRTALVGILAAVAVLVAVFMYGNNRLSAK